MTFLNLTTANTDYEPAVRDVPLLHTTKHGKIKHHLIRYPFLNVKNMRRIPFYCFYIIPGLFFAMLGAIDILADVYHHKLNIRHFLFNAALFVPLLIRKAIVFKAFGIIAGLFSLYFALALLVFLSQYLGGAAFNVFETFVIGPVFVVTLMLLSVSLFYAGYKMPISNTTAI